MDDIGSLLSRPRLYRNIDGLVELGASVMCLGWALLFWLMRLPADSVWHRNSFLGFIVLMFLIPWGTKAVKTRITYPRTGFVEYRKRWQTSAIAGAVGGLVAVGLGVALRRNWDLSVLGSLSGLAFAASYGYHFATAVRWKWVVGGAMAAASLVITFLPAEVLGALGSDSPVTHPDRAKLGGIILLSLLGYGTMLLISGGISLWLYLRHTQAPLQEGQ